MFCADSLEDVAAIVVRSAGLRVAAEHIDVVGFGEIVPEVLESNRRIRSAISQQDWRAFSARGDVRIAVLSPLSAPWR